jgi:hypothetical protein
VAAGFAARSDVADAALRGEYGHVARGRRRLWRGDRAK